MCILSSAPARNQSCYRCCCCYRTQFHPFLSPTSHASGERSFDPGSTPYHSLTLSHLVYIYTWLCLAFRQSYSLALVALSRVHLFLSLSLTPALGAVSLYTYYLPRASATSESVCEFFKGEREEDWIFGSRRTLCVRARMCKRERERERAGKKDDTL